MLSALLIISLFPWILLGMFLVAVRQATEKRLTSSPEEMVHLYGMEKEHRHVQTEAAKLQDRPPPPLEEGVSSLNVELIPAESLERFSKEALMFYFYLWQTKLADFKDYPDRVFLQTELFRIWKEDSKK